MESPEVAPKPSHGCSQHEGTLSISTPLNAVVLGAEAEVWGQGAETKSAGGDSTAEAEGVELGDVATVPTAKAAPTHGSSSNDDDVVELRSPSGSEPADAADQGPDTIPHNLAGDDSSPSPENSGDGTDASKQNEGRKSFNSRRMKKNLTLRKRSKQKEPEDVLAETEAQNPEQEKIRDAVGAWIGSPSQEKRTVEDEKRRKAEEKRKGAEVKRRARGEKKKGRGGKGKEMGGGKRETFGVEEDVIGPDIGGGEKEEGVVEELADEDPGVANMDSLLSSREQRIKAAVDVWMGTPTSLKKETPSKRERRLLYKSVRKQAPKLDMDAFRSSGDGGGEEVLGKDQRKIQDAVKHWMSPEPTPANHEPKSPRQKKGLRTVVPLRRVDLKRKKDKSPNGGTALDGTDEDLPVLSSPSSISRKSLKTSPGLTRSDLPSVDVLRRQIATVEMTKAGLEKLIIFYTAGGGQDPVAAAEAHKEHDKIRLELDQLRSQLNVSEAKRPASERKGTPPSAVIPVEATPREVEDSPTSAANKLIALFCREATRGDRFWQLFEVYEGGDGCIVLRPRVDGHQPRMSLLLTGAVGVEDYTLAPTERYPYALYECFEAYKWLLENHKRIGIATDCDEPLKVVLVGDSAGGNLVSGVVQLALHHEIAMPCGLLLVYPAAHLTRTASFSRLVFGNDPVLSRLASEHCVDAYLGSTDGGCDGDTDPLISPAVAPVDTLKRFPRTFIIVGGIDPLLDDSVRMADVLRMAGVDVTLRVYDGLPHGFLNLSETIPNCRRPIVDAYLILQDLLGAS